MLEEEAVDKGLSDLLFVLVEGGEDLEQERELLFPAPLVLWQVRESAGTCGARGAASAWPVGQSGDMMRT